MIMMFRHIFLSQGSYVIWVVALFSFVVGVLLGKQVPRAAGQKRRPGRENRDRGRTGNGSELYVGNLSYEMSHAELGKLFERFGKVVSARVIMSKVSGDSRGYGFVQMGSSEEAKAALDSLNGQTIKGRRIALSEARTRPRDRDR